MDETDAHLLRSLQDERQYVLMPRLKQLEDALLLISALSADVTHPAKARVILEIHQTAEKALTL